MDDPACQYHVYVLVSMHGCAVCYLYVCIENLIPLTNAFFNYCAYTGGPNRNPNISVCACGCVCVEISQCLKETGKFLR